MAVGQEGMSWPTVTLVGCGSQCLSLGTDMDPRWAACSARTTLMLRSGGPVMDGSGPDGVEAGGSGTDGLRIRKPARMTTGGHGSITVTMVGARLPVYFRTCGAV